MKSRLDPKRITLSKLAQNLRNKYPVPITITVPQKNFDVTLKGKERAQELKFIEGFLKLEEKILLKKAKVSKDTHASALRYQKRAINQLVKGIREIARDKSIEFLQNEANSG